MKFIGKLLNIIMVFTVLALGVSAVSITDFSQVTDMNGEYELAQDIVLPENFTPVGTKDNPFIGNFDGNGYTISGVYSAIFAYTNDAEIKNIRVENSTLVSAQFFGGIVANAGGSTEIDNCSFLGNIVIDGGFAVNGGGIAGFLGENAIIRNCYASAQITEKEMPYSLNFGGICGRNKGKIEICFSEGSLAAASSQYRLVLGGICGENLGKISGCGNGASVNGSVNAKAAQTFVGGITGYNNGGMLTRCANIATSVSGYGKNIYPAYAGGIAGVNINGILDVVKNKAGIFGVKSYISGIAALNLGYKGSAVITNALNEGEVTCSNGVFAGMVAANAITDDKASFSEVSYSLNLGSAYAFNKNDGYVMFVYSTGVSDSYSENVTEDELKENGIDKLTENNEVWQNNCEISELPDLLIVYDDKSPVMISSRNGESGLSYFLYTPENEASAFIAVFYDGNRYLNMKYAEKTEETSFIKLAVSDIPEGTDVIKFIAFKDTFEEGFSPVSMSATEIAYQNN